MGVHYGLLRNCFGYGSGLDNIQDDSEGMHLCERCWTKALHAVGIPVHAFDPALCPVCRKPRRGKHDHPNCMKRWPPFIALSQEQERSYFKKWKAEKRSKRRSASASSL